VNLIEHKCCYGFEAAWRARPKIADFVAAPGVEGEKKASPAEFMGSGRRSGRV
jgi:hypothetical protein